MQLTDKERLTLLFQLSILEKIEPSNPSIKEAKKIIERGYTLDYAILHDFLENELPENDCRFVRDVLSMYRHIINSNKNNDRKIDNITFLGFNSSSAAEYRLSEYCLFLLNDLNLYMDVKGIFINGGCENEDMRLKYLNMLSIWENISKIQKEYLTFEQISELLAVLDK